MIKDLFLPITQTGGDGNALAAAVAMASAHGAHLAVAQPVDLPLPMSSPWGVTPEYVLEQMYAELREGALQHASRLRERLAREDVAWDVRVEEAMFVDPPRALARAGRYADMAVMAAPVQDADDAAMAHAFFSAMLFESGRPVLVVPAHHPIELPIRRALVAWKPTREATRAVHDALPLLAQAAAIEVVAVHRAEDGRPDDDAGTAIATHLARHGLPTNVLALARVPGQTVATTLLQRASEVDAQLLVAGGYGHSRLREWILGGTTRELAQATHLPILFSH